MISIALDANGLVRSRFALSRLAELTCGLEVLAHPGRAPYARGWVERTRRRLRRDDLGLLLAVVERATWYVPDFLVPVPATYEPTLADELAAVAATPPEVVRDQLRAAFRIGPPPPGPLPHAAPAPVTGARAPASGPADPGAPPAAADPRPAPPAEVAEALAGGEAALAGALAEQLGRCWERALADSWPVLRRLLDEDVRHRAALASQVGLGEIVSGIHPRLRWDGRRLTLGLPYEVSREDATGLVLIPSVFLPRVAVWLGNPSGVLVGYPARGRGQVWAGPRPSPYGAKMLGPRRAELLADLALPRSTTELATRHRLSPATVSYHLGRLHAAGLLRRRQDGHSVLYERTERAEVLLVAIDPAHAPVAIDPAHAAGAAGTGGGQRSPAGPGREAESAAWASKRSPNRATSGSPTTAR
ncbi:winged helix-turn-helix domain-containing protein [Micromonospora sp. NPDC049559]|uniref:winged helix-turn-helix domain-containing protein n=1 Tax=Micromonospora sp. NPDC049559 TaxID=3155923 RepID=UPI003421E029